jgi:hypothetical protein
MFCRTFFGVVVATLGLFIAQAEEPLSPNDEPAAIQTQGLPPAIGPIRPTDASHLPAQSPNFSLKNGKTNVVGRKVEQKSLNGSHVIRLTGHPSIEHTSARNGSIRVTSDRIAGQTNPDDNRLTVAFDGNVLLVVGELMLTADSATLTRTDSGWSLTEIVARSAEGNVHYHRDCGSCGNTKLTSLR